LNEEWKQIFILVTLIFIGLILLYHFFWVFGGLFGLLFCELIGGLFCWLFCKLLY
jgi:hypothetical protein